MTLPTGLSPQYTRQQLCFPHNCVGITEFPAKATRAVPEQHGRVIWYDLRRRLETCPLVRLSQICSNLVAHLRQEHRQHWSCQPDTDRLTQFGSLAFRSQLLVNPRPPRVRLARRGLAYRLIRPPGCCCPQGMRRESGFSRKNGHVFQKYLKTELLQRTGNSTKPAARLAICENFGRNVL